MITLVDAFGYEVRSTSFYLRMIPSYQRGSAVEQENVGKDRKPSSARYWYARRIGQVQSRILEAIDVSRKKRDEGGEGALMVKVCNPRGNATKSDPAEDSLNFLALGRQKERNKLLRKREYFKDGVLGNPRAAAYLHRMLKRVEARRMFEFEHVDAVVRTSYSSEDGTIRDVHVTPRVLNLTIVAKPSLKGCSSKTKENVKKYTAGVRDRMLKKLSKYNEKVESSAFRAEKRRQEAERAEVARWEKERNELVRSQDLSRTVAASFFRRAGLSETDEAIALVGRQIPPPPSLREGYYVHNVQKEEALPAAQAIRTLTTVNERLLETSVRPEVRPVDRSAPAVVPGKLINKTRRSSKRR